MNSNDDKQTVKSGLVNTIANIFSLLVGVVMIPIISRVIPADDIGTASIFVSTRNCLTIVIAAATYDYLYKAMLEFPQNKKNYVSSIVSFILMMTVVSFVLSLPFKTYVKNTFSLDEFLYYWLFISIAINTLGFVGHHYSVFHNKYILILLMVIATGPISQILGLGLAYIMPSHKYIGRILGLDFYNMAIAIGLIGWLIFSVLQGDNIKPSVKYIKKTLVFSLPIIPHLLSQMILTQSDLIVIGRYTDSGKSGIYSMAHTVGNLAYTVLIQALVVWSPWVYRRLAENNKTQVYHNSKIMILLGSYLSVGLLTVSTELIKIFLADTYLPCIYIVPPLTCSMFFQFINVFMYDVNYYNKKSSYIAIPSIIAAVLNLILNIVFIQKFGYLAACYTTLISYFIQLVISFLFCRRLDVSHIYDIRYIVGTVIFVVAYATAMIGLRDSIIIRYVLLFAVSIILFATQYKKVIGLFKIIKSER